MNEIIVKTVLYEGQIRGMFQRGRVRYIYLKHAWRGQKPRLKLILQ